VWFWSNLEWGQVMGRWVYGVIQVFAGYGALQKKTQYNCS